LPRERWEDDITQSIGAQGEKKRYPEKERDAQIRVLILSHSRGGRFDVERKKATTYAVELRQLKREKNFTQHSVRTGIAKGA